MAIADLYANIFEIGSAGNLSPGSEQYKNMLELTDLWLGLLQQYDAVQASIEKAVVFLHVS